MDCTPQVFTVLAGGEGLRVEARLHPRKLGESGYTIVYFWLDRRAVQSQAGSYKRFADFLSGLEQDGFGGSPPISSAVYQGSDGALWRLLLRCCSREHPISTELPA